MELIAANSSPFPATGRQITVKGMVDDRVVAGKMVDSRVLMDGLGMMMQLGVIPAEKPVTWPNKRSSEVSMTYLDRNSNGPRQGALDAGRIDPERPRAILSLPD